MKIGKMDVKITDNSKEILNAKDEAIAKALEMIGIKAERYAKLDCPVDTGLLRNSISHAQEKATAYIGTNVEYAEKVEYGDNVKHITGKAHFLRDAATNHSDEYKNIVENALKGSTS
jgi:phage gpG-like protein